MTDSHNRNSPSGQSADLDWANSQISGVFSERYRIERTLGSGAMAYVLLATDSVLERKVAIKVPQHRPVEQAEITEKRFLREAQAAAGLTHPNICPIYDVGQTDETWFITMGYIEGCLLSQVIRETEHFEEAEVAQVIRKIASGAAEAHRLGILHRDLKPSNIMIDRRGEPIILDFGLARFLERPEADQTLTEIGQTLGTPAYMSPEQATGTRELTPASDIFSLGVIMWEMLCGERPFAGDTHMMMGQIVHGIAPSPRSRRPDLSSDLEAICLKALAKAPEDRFESMQQFEYVLDDVLNGREVSIDLSKVTADRRSNDTLDLRQSPRSPSSPDPDTQVESAAISRVIRHPLFWVWSALGVIFVLLVFIAAQGFLRPPGPPGQDAQQTGPGGNPRDDRPFPPGPGGDRDRRGPGRFPPPRPGMSAEEVFEQYDVDGDEHLDESEFPRHIIRRIDANEDHQLDLKELVTGLLIEGPDLFLPPEEGEGPPGEGGPRGERQHPPEGRRPPRGGPGDLGQGRPPREGFDGFGPPGNRPPPR